MPDNAHYLAFLSDPDQASREMELKIFLGPNAERFIPAYRGLRPGASGKPSFSLRGAGFSIGAFFTGPVWFFYRKLWSAAWTVTALLVVFAGLGLVFPHAPLNRLGLPIAVILALNANRICVMHAVQRIQTLRTPDGTVTQEVLTSQGGISKRAAWIAGLVYGGITLLSFLSIIYLAMHGIAPE